MDLQFLTNTPLFQGIGPEELSEMLTCLQGEARRYERGAQICRAGEPIHSMGLLLQGSVSIENVDVWGNRSILDRLEPGQVFGETYACLPGEPMMVSVVAEEPCEVLFLSVGRLLHLCPNTCGHHSRLIANLLSISARKNLTLSRRIFHTSSKTIRGRLLSYLSFQAARTGSCTFDIPFSRQQLADYLQVDRSALSNELSKMQREGLLQVRRSHFTLTQSGRDHLL